MSEASEAEKTVYSPRDTHLKWLDKANIAAKYAFSTVAAATTAGLAERANSFLSTREILQDVASQMGRTISPEFIKQLTDSANYNKEAAVVAGLISVITFGMGTFELMSIGEEK